MRLQRSLSRRTSAAERPHPEAGFTLIELMIVSALLLTVIVVIFNALTNVQKSETYTRGRAQALDDMRTVLDRMSRELRQASNVVATPTSSHIEFDTYDFGTPIHVTYDASGTSLTRKVGSSAATTMQTGLTTTSIFSYTPDAGDPQTVEITLSVKPTNLPATTVTLESEVRLRNRVVTS